MADYTQADHVFIAHAHFVNDTTYANAGTALDVRTFLSGTIYISHAPIEDATANDPAIKYLIQINHDDSAGLEYWHTIQEVGAVVAASTMETLDDTAASGQQVVPVAATTDLTIEDWVYIMDDGGAAGSEWAKVADIDAGVSFTTVDNLTNAFASGEDVFIEGVFRTAVNLDNLGGVAWVRVLNVNPDPTGCNWAAAVTGKFATDIT